MAANWDALIMGDYEAIMPLPWKKKYGIYYLYQPEFTAQLGIFSVHPVKDIINKFISNIPKKFLFYDIAVNPQSAIVSKLNNKNIICRPRNDFLLPLNKDYAGIKKSYKKAIIHDINKATRAGFVIKVINDPEPLIIAAKKYLKKRCAVNKKAFENLMVLSKFAITNGHAKVYCVYNNNGKLVSGIVFFMSRARNYGIVQANTQEGRNNGASAFLIDSFIKEQANANLILDFGGSDIASIAHFFKGFGAQKENYYQWYYNNLPPLIRLLK